MTKSNGPESQAEQGFLQRILRGSHHGIWEWNARTNQALYSPRWAEILGTTPEELGNSLGDWFDRVHPEDRSQLESRFKSVETGKTENLVFEYRIRHADAQYRWVLVHAHATRDPEGTCLWITGSQADVSERKRLEKAVFRHSFFDPLTGLPNQSLLLDRTRQRLSGQSETIALIALGVDRSMEIRDTLGPDASDRLLIQLARYLRSLFEEGFTVARVGGYHFAILLESRQTASTALETARSLVAQIPAKSFQIAERRIALTISLGVVLGSSDYSSSEDMLRDAMTALETARSRGSEQALLFEPWMRDRVVSKLHLEQELRNSLENGRLRPVLQPMVSLDTGRLAGFEALGRLWLEDGKVVPPQSFLPIADEIGKIGEVDRLVLREVCRIWRDWRRDRIPLQGLFFSVNASPQLLSQRDLIPWLDTTLREVGMDPGRLVFEITEAGIDWEPELVEEGLRHVHSLGIRLALDGFGRGRFSLGRFETLPFEMVKIDQRALEHPEPELVLSPLLQLVKNLKLEAVIQGLETRAKCNEARKLGCRFGQGFFLSEPLEEKAAATLANSADPLFWPEDEGSHP